MFWGVVAFQRMKHARLQLSRGLVRILSFSHLDLLPRNNVAVGLSAGEHPSLVNIKKRVQTASLERKVCRWRDFFGAELLGTSLRRIVFFFSLFYFVPSSE